MAIPTQNGLNESFLFSKLPNIPILILGRGINLSFDDLNPFELQQIRFQLDASGG
jgi:hypothetical protein